MDLTALRNRVQAIVAPAVADGGLDLENVSITRAGNRHVVRVIVDGDSGLGHDELSSVSRGISAALDAAEAASGELTRGGYTLEVSSPGVDRPLTTARHWRRSVGRLVKVRFEGRMVTARVVNVDDSPHGDAGSAKVSLDEDGRTRVVDLADLGPGKVQVEFTRVDEVAWSDDEADDEATDETDDEFDTESAEADGEDKEDDA